MDSSLGKREATMQSNLNCQLQLLNCSNLSNYHNNHQRPSRPKRRDVTENCCVMLAWRTLFESTSSVY